MTPEDQRELETALASCELDPCVIVRCSAQGCGRITAKVFNTPLGLILDRRWHQTAKERRYYEHESTRRRAEAQRTGKSISVSPRGHMERHLEHIGRRNPPAAVEVKCSDHQPSLVFHSEIIERDPGPGRTAVFAPPLGYRDPPHSEMSRLA